MTRTTVIGALSVVAVVGLSLAFLIPAPAARNDPREPASPTPPANRPATPAIATVANANSGFLYGRITDAAGTFYEGRLRWGGDQEAFWSDLFDGARRGNPWAAYAPAVQGGARSRIEVFGFEIGGPDRSNLQRLFLARFGDIARIEAHFRDVQLTLKSGTAVTLDRFAAGDIDDGVRVWDRSRGVVDLDSRRIRTIELLPTPLLSGAPGRLHGVVRTRHADFTGPIQWNQQDGADTDTLDSRTSDGEVSLRYGTIRAVTRQSRDSAVATLRDGREVMLSRGRDVGRGNRGIYVDDLRFGRVLVPWDAFERVDFTSGGSAPAYGDFPPGQHLAGSVTTRDGRRLAGRLVYDFDESETTETLDVSCEGIDYAIPFSLVTSIVPPGRDGRSAGPGRVVLRHGGTLPIERSGDAGDRNAGMLVFGAGRNTPDYVAWTDVAQIDFTGNIRPTP